MTESKKTVNAILIEDKNVGDPLTLIQGDVDAIFGTIISSIIGTVQVYETEDHIVTVEGHRFMVLSKKNHSEEFFVVRFRAYGGTRIFYESGGVFGKWLQFGEKGILYWLHDERGPVMV